MKQIIPFSKEIEFKSMINKITSISLEHTLSLENEFTVKGNFLISGTYKMTEASQIDEEFNYKIPVEVNIDNKYDTKDIIIDIDDFVYSIVDEERLSIKIDLLIDKLIEKEKVIDDNNLFEDFESISLNDEEKNIVIDRDVGDIENLFLETSEKEDLSISEDIIDNIDESSNKDENNNLLESDNVVGVESIFSAFNNTEETFTTYVVYIVRENDTIDSIIEKYNTTKEILEEYNNLKDIKIGSKVIIPNYNNE